MKVFAISDLHLSSGRPKPMDVFGPAWENHAEKILAGWHSSVSDSDMVLVAGDISWAMTFEEALPDLRFMDDLPGRKVVIKGNHDYWWPSITRLRREGPASIQFIQNDVLEADDLVISGTRLWSYPYVQWDGCVETTPNPLPVQSVGHEVDDEKVGRRELERLKLCLRQMSKDDGRLKVFLTHFPPVGGDFTPNPITQIMSEAGIQVCLFGHLHNVSAEKVADRTVEGIRYALTSCDYLGFTPKLVRESG